MAIMLPNVPQFAVSMAGVLRAGFTCVNVNPLYTARELEHQLKDSGATAIIILENFAHTLAQVLERTAIRHICLTGMGDLLGGLYGSWITFAVRHLAKMVPALIYLWDQVANSARSHHSTRPWPPEQTSNSHPAMPPSTRRLFCNTRAAPRACPKARC